MCREVAWIELTAKVTSVPLFRSRALGFVIFNKRIIKNLEIKYNCSLLWLQFFLVIIETRMKTISCFVSKNNMGRFYKK